MGPAVPCRVYAARKAAIRPTGPAARPIPTTNAPLSTRESRAVHATPIRWLASPPRAAPAANRPQDTADTGPMITPARSVPPTSSASRTWLKVSKAIMATLQNTSTSTTLRSTGAVRSSPTPSATVRGT